MSADPSLATETASAHDLAAEAEHARHHAVHNNWFFLTFFSIVGLAVLSYEFTTNSWSAIFLLGGLRFALIAVFLYSLIRTFSLVVKTIAFTVFFFAGMVYLSMWGSTLKHVGNPIVVTPPPAHRS